MRSQKFILSAALLFGIYLSSNAQSFVPPNMDFESASAANWTYYAGTVAVGHVYTLTAVSPTAGLHTLTSGSGTDAYGGFPIVGMGSYSLKLARDTTNNNADAATYDIHVPSGASYSLIYHYAAVLEDPGHLPAGQPILQISAVDSATGIALPGAVDVLPATAGFSISSVGLDVTYKPWTTASFDLAGYGGHTVTMKFTVAGCGTGGHFGYGYIDVSDVFATSYYLPSSATTVTMDAPPGFASYTWTDATTYTAAYGTTPSVTITAPTVTTTYAVIVTPAAGHSTVDTLYTTVHVSSSLRSTITCGRWPSINIYPNPSSGDVKIQWGEQNTGFAVIEVTDVMGRVVSRSQLNMNKTSGEQHLDLGALNNGIYFVSIKSPTINYREKVVIKK